MKKLYFLFSVLTVLFFNRIEAQIATVDPSGNFSVNGISSLWWDYQYKPSGSSTYTQSTIQYGNPISVIKLNPFISWDFRIRYYNFYGQPGTWSQDYVVNGNYPTITSKTVGYSFNFDTSFMDEGWRGYRLQNTTSGYNSNIEESNYLYNGSSGKSIYMGWQTGNGMMMVSPKISDLSTDKKFSFKTLSYQGSYSLVVGTITNPYDPTTFHPLKTVTLTSDSQFYKVDVFLNNYANNDQYIAIKTEGSYGNVYLDDFTYDQSVNCFPLTEVTLNNVTEKTAAIQYESNTALSYEISLKRSDKYQPDIFYTDQKTFVFNNLVGLKDYEVKVRGKCAENLYTNWSTPINFKTPCSQITSNYFTSFEEDNNNQLNPCWSKIMSESSLYITESSPTMPAITGSKIIQISAGSSQTQQAYLITPYITDLNNSKRIKFYLTTGSSNYIQRSIIVGTMSSPNDASTFKPIKTIAPEELNQIDGYKTNGYLKQHIVYFDNYNNNLNHNYISIKIDNAPNYSSDYIYLDDFTYESSPNCREAFNLKTLTTTFNTAKVSWSTETNQPQNYEIEYGTKGFKIGEGTRLNVQNLPFEINSNLTSDTEYDFYVRVKCNTEYSNWSDRGYFKTKCEGFNAPYFDGFENKDFKTGTCWSRHTIDIKDSFYSPNSFVTIYRNNAHPTLPYKGSYAGYVTNRHYGKDILAAEKNILITPRLIDLDNSKTIKFWAVQPYSGSIIEIGTLSNPEDYTTFKLYKSIVPNSSTYNKWTQYTVDFSGFYGSDKFVGIRIKNSGSDGFLYIDDFSYENNPCKRPTNLSAYQSDTNSAILNWNTNTNEPINCEIEFENGQKFIVNQLPFVYENIDNNSSYVFKVRNLCGDVINWSDSYAFKVSCPVNTPFRENFDTYTVGNIYGNFGCWTIYNDPSKTPNAYPRIVNYEQKNINSAPNCLEIYKNDSVDLYLISPYLSDFNQNKKIKFWLNTFYSAGFTPQKIKIGTLSNPNDINTFEPYSELLVNELPKYGKEFEMDFSTYTGSNKFIALVFTNENNQTYFSIDDFQYLTNLSCKEPINVEFKNITSNSCLVKWENIVNNPVQIEYGLKGFQIGTGTKVLASTNELIINNLSKNSDYEFYLTTLCSNENSHVVGPKFVSTSCDVYSLPWLEKFNNQPSYGLNQLPNCMNTLYGGLESINTPRTLYTNYYRPDQTLNGNGDSAYLLLNKLHPSILTPSFDLKAGVCYKFSIDGRKAYEYRAVNLRLYAGRGRELHYMEAELSKLGTLSEYNYNTNSFYFTPLENGIYSFVLSESSSPTDANMIVDNFKLEESYNTTINYFNNFNFEYGIPSEFITENISNATSDVVTDGTNKVVELSGGYNEIKSNFQDFELWNKNQSSISKLNFKISPLDTNPLSLRFDLKQTYITNPEDSQFRVIINGVQKGGIIKPITKLNDSYITYQFDLSEYRNKEIYVSLQHIGKKKYRPSGTNKLGFISNGDSALIDNISISNYLSDDDFIYKSLLIYPNPTKDIINISNDTNIDSYEILSLSGQILKSEKLNNSVFNVFLNDLQNGVYFLRLDSEKTFKTVKIIKN